ncbi:MAG: DUF1294 domain-containing protein [Pirellulaceae bacterium]|nr:DUF1294 domain-containing protein [Pirellulaceae bacterium]
MVTGFAIWTLLASGVTAMLYVWDKRAAINDRPRVAEATLLGWSALGGWPGGLIAGKLVRHKTQKLTYRVRFVCCAILHLTIAGFVLYFTRG